MGRSRDACGFGDGDGDGCAAVFVTNYAHETNTLYRNRGGGHVNNND